VVGLKSATKFVPLLSRKACYRLALLLGSLAAMLDRRGPRVGLSNLRVAFGDEISSERRTQIVRESYQHFARTMLDFFWSPRLTSQNFSRYGYARSRLSMIVRYVEVSVHLKRLMMSGIQPSAAAPEAELMEQEQHYPCSVVVLP
jgi:Bacterial lipid A biosynthesis acyltransferase